jgi:lipid-A-disaccharide synthase
MLKKLRNKLNPTIENLEKAFNEFDRSKFLQDSKELRAYLQHGSSKTIAKMIEE